MRSQSPVILGSFLGVLSLGCEKGPNVIETLYQDAWHRSYVQIIFCLIGSRTIHRDLSQIEGAAARL